MNKSIIIEALSMLATSSLVVLLFNPYQIWMPMPAHLIIVGTLLISLIILSLVLLKQLKEDEREQTIRLFSYKAGYLAASITLTTAVIYQSFSHSVDPWIVVSLIAMFGTKLFSLCVHYRIH